MRAIGAEVIVKPFQTKTESRRDFVVHATAHDEARVTIAVAKAEGTLVGRDDDEIIVGVDEGNIIVGVDEGNTTHLRGDQALG